jgi:pyruvate/2-oxoglutarate dehydrogenase complex dihydrolipoamide acyltransferase (E2) component
VASKVVGRIASIGVDKGDHVTQGQVIARLEDDEYRAQVQQAEGNLNNLKANCWSNNMAHCLRKFRDLNRTSIPRELTPKTIASLWSAPVS